MFTPYTRIATAMLFCLLTTLAFAQTQVTVTATAGSGTYDAGPALFGTTAAGVSGPLVESDPVDACGAITNDLTGAVALLDLVSDPGCDFAVKAVNVQAAGAIGAVMCINIGGISPFAMIGNTPTLTIPVVTLDSVSCAAFRADLTGATIAISGGDTPTLSCQSAEVVTDGTVTAGNIDVGFAEYSFATDEEHARWYRYEVPSDGIVNINSCSSGIDTRFYVAVSDDCNAVGQAIIDGDLLVLEDQCGDVDGDPYSSEYEAIHSAGEVLYFFWVNRWDESGFDFEISTSAIPVVGVTFQVDVSEEDLMGQAVRVGGSFTDTLIDLTDQGNGLYATTVNIDGGTDLNYLFYIGDTAEPVTDLGDCTVDDGMGNAVRSLSVALEPVTLGAVCFGQCTPCTISVTDCDAPFVFFEDDLENYDLDSDPTGVNSWWETWAGAPGGVIVDSIGDTKSYAISESFANMDVVLAVGPQTSGHHVVSFDLYVPEGNAGYFNFQHEMPDANGYYAFDVFFRAGGTVDVQTYENGVLEGAANYPQGSFFPVTSVINIEEDIVTLYINGLYLGSWPWSNGALNADVSYTSSELYGVNFYPIPGDADEYTYYVDNVTHYQIPEAAPGSYCYTASTIQPGTHTTETLDCFGGFERSGWSAQWYAYTPTTDGRITVSACDNGGDTRTWILQGDCSDFSVVGVNDDQDDCGADEFASLREAYVYAGNTYYILWDARWESDAVTWTLDFTEEAGEPGRFCQTAIDVTPGIYSVDNLSDISGNAAFSTLVLPNLNFTSQNSTPAAYAQTIWYSYTAAADGMITITSCELTTEDTRVVVSTGDCTNFDNQTVVAAADDGCDVADPTFLTFMGEAGTTYFIEWDDVNLENGFLWELQGAQPATVNVTFSVDVSLEDTPADTAFVIGEFVGWGDPIALEDQGNGLFVGTVEVPANDSFAFKFQNGRGNFEGGDFLENCGVEGGFGFDRLLVTGEDDITMDEVCFRYCVDCQTVDTKNPIFNNAFRIQPNPATDLVEVSYQLPDTRNLQLTLTNTLGQTVRTEQLGRVSAGSHRLDVSALGSGLYYLVITDGTYTHSEKLIKR